MRFMSLSIPLMAIFMIITFLAFSDYQQETWTELQERHLDTAMNFAVDAAVEYMTENTSDLGLDYAEFEYVTVDPELALEMFKRVILRNLGYSDSEQNDAYIENCMPLFVVATYDGYYLARERIVADSDAGTEYKLVFNPKMPYTYEVDVGSTKYLYALNLGLQDAIRYYGDASGGHYDRIFIDPSFLTEDQQKTIISSRISDDMIINLWDIRGGQSIDTTILIPADMTTWTSTNPINATTVLAYVDGINLGVGVEQDCFGIGGARVVHENFVVAYEYNGKNVYCYAGRQPNGVVVKDSFMNPTLAAEAGYEFDMTYFDRY